MASRLDLPSHIFTEIQSKPIIVNSLKEQHIIPVTNSHVTSKVNDIIIKDVSEKINILKNLMESHTHSFKKLDKAITKITSLSDKIDACILNQNTIIEEIKCIKLKLNEFE